MNSEWGKIKLDYRRLTGIANAGSIRGFLVAACSPGFHAVLIFRFGKAISSLPRYLEVLILPVYVILNLYVRVFWGIEIGRNARIQGGLYIGHFGGIIISRHTVAGVNLSIHQGVTIGIAGKLDNRGCPNIGDNVYFSPGSKAYGKISIGDKATIGANAVAHKDVPTSGVVVVKTEIR